MFGQIYNRITALPARTNPHENALAYMQEKVFSNTCRFAHFCYNRGFANSGSSKTYDLLRERDAIFYKTVKVNFYEHQ